MTLKIIDHDFTVCKVSSLDAVSLAGEFFFVGKTDEELSLVCLTELAPDNTSGREDGWRAFRIEGVLDFSLTGILAPIAQILADNNIGIFAISTFNTDYILVKRENLSRAVSVLRQNGYDIV